MFIFFKNFRLISPGLLGFRSSPMYWWIGRFGAVDGLGGAVDGFDVGTGGAFGRFGGFAIGLAFGFGAVIGAFCSG